MFRALFLNLFMIGVVHAQQHDGIAVSDIVEKADVQILSTNLANGNTRGEWGLSALVRADEHCVLFDAGRFADSVVHNAKELKVDLNCVDAIVLSHFHSDHTGGLSTILSEIKATEREEPIRIYVAKGFFKPRYLKQSHSVSQDEGDSQADQLNQMIELRESLETQGAQFIEIIEPTQIVPGVWATGPVERKFDERNYPKMIVFQNAVGETTVDYVPESQGLVIRTAQGPIVLSGCGHSGSVNLATHVRENIQDMPLLALMGGLHLAGAPEEVLAWTGENLKSLGVQNLMAGHCTGVHPMYVLRDALGLDRATAVIGAVGARFELDHGIHPTIIAR